MEVNLSALKVLVVDDSSTIRQSAATFLQQAGIEVHLAQDGLEALSKVNDHRPDMIFCDILMPRLDGFEFCALLKRNARFSAVPVVMLTACDGVFDKARARLVGARGYLTKPFHQEQLLQAVQQHGLLPVETD